MAAYSLIEPQNARVRRLACALPPRILSIAHAGRIRKDRRPQRRAPRGAQRRPVRDRHDAADHRSAYAGRRGDPQRTGTVPRADPSDAADRDVLHRLHDARHFLDRPAVADRRVCAPRPRRACGSRDGGAKARSPTARRSPNICRPDGAQRRQGSMSVTPRPRKRAGDSLIIRMLRSLVVGVAGLGLLLFLPAGTLNYWQAWILIAVFVLGSNALGLYLATHLPCRQGEHLQRREHQGVPGPESDFDRALRAGAAPDVFRDPSLLLGIAAGAR